jgi:hypothetical protein
MKKLLLLFGFSCMSWVAAYKTEERKTSSVDDVACLVMGYGNTLGDVFYLGLESLYEIGSRKSKDILSDSYKGELTYSTKSVQLGARLGYVIRDMLLFVRGGVALTGKNKYKLEKTKFFAYGEKEETPRVIEEETKGSTPFVSAGVEKAVFNRVSLRLEAETLKRRSYANRGSSCTKAIRLMLVWNVN